MTILKYLGVNCLFIIFLSSCIKNPEAELQNERIKDLQEKNTYILEIVKEQNQKLSEMEEKINVIEKRSHIINFKSFKNRSAKKDTINLKIFEGQVSAKNNR